MGRAGETIAVWYLSGAGLQVVGRNIGVGRGEVDILAIDGGDRVAVEVRTTSGPADPIDAVDAAKRRQVSRLGRQIGANRIDFIGIRVGNTAMDIHWLPGRS